MHVSNDCKNIVQVKICIPVRLQEVWTTFQGIVFPSNALQHRPLMIYYFHQFPKVKKERMHNNTKKNIYIKIQPTFQKFNKK